MSKTLLTETIMPEKKPLVAETRDGGYVYLKGLFLEGETKNHNGRIYPKPEIEKAVNQLNKKIQENGPIPGELDHPEGLNINFDRISHLITEMHMNDTHGYGTMKVINAGMGLIVKGCVEAGMQVGVSSRGSGDIGHDGRVSDFDIVTIDCVANPSARNAYPQASLAESVMGNKHGREALSLTQYYHDDPRAQRYLEKEITKFLTEIRDSVTWRK